MLIIEPENGHTNRIKWISIQPSHWPLKRVFSAANERLMLDFHDNFPKIFDKKL